MTRWRWWWAVLAFFAIPIALYAASFLYFGQRAFPPPLKESFLARPWGIYPHALIGAIALISGPFQFNRRLLLRRRRVHRVMGRIYVIGALLTGVVGTYMAWYAFGGPITQVGFAGLGIALLITTIKAFTSIKAGDVRAHRQWMIRSFALLFGAVTLRIELPILVGSSARSSPPTASWRGRRGCRTYWLPRRSCMARRTARISPSSGRSLKTGRAAPRMRE